MGAQINQFGVPVAVLAARDAEYIAYGWLVAAGGVLAGLGVMTPITKGCRPARMMVAMPVPMATATEDAQAETVHRLCRSTSRLAVNPFLRSTARSARMPIVRAKMSSWTPRRAAECHCRPGLVRVPMMDGAAAAAKKEMLLLRPVLPRSSGKK